MDFTTGYQLAGEVQHPADTGHATGEFLLRCLLGARQEADSPSNCRGYDEDVNIYLVGLLLRFFSPSYHDEARRFVHTSDLDLVREAATADDVRTVFQLYKINADHLLLGIGLFCHVEGAHSSANPLFHREPEEFIHRGGVYYHIASSNLRRLRRAVSAPEIAMRKLGDGFADYAGVLRRVRTSYFHLTERLGEGTLFHLAGARSTLPAAAAPSTEGAPPDVGIKALYDVFLDAFSAWKAAPGPKTQQDLQAAAARLRVADPQFCFALPEEPAT